MTTKYDIVDALIGKVVEKEKSLGIKLDWESKLPKGKLAWTAREIVNAIGLTLSEAGIINNLYREKK